jgi:hypothetical protein
MSEKPKCRCQYRERKVGHTCLFCIRSEIRRAGQAGLVCALCDEVGHPAKYCPRSTVGRARSGGGSLVKRCSRPVAG